MEIRGSQFTSLALSHQDAHVPRLTQEVSKTIPAATLLTQEKVISVTEHLYSEGYTACVMFSREPSPINQ